MADMKMGNYLRSIAGTLVFSSALLGYLHSERWLFFTMFVGLNLLQFGFTNRCPMAFYA